MLSTVPSVRAGRWPRARAATIAAMAPPQRDADFCFEVGHLARTPRSGFAQLGERVDHQSVAEHSHRAAVIGMTLAWRTRGVDPGRVAQLCLVHDLPETRTLDLHHLAQRYATVDERAAVADLIDQLDFGGQVAALIDEYVARQTPESRLAHEADTLELICALKELIDHGNPRANAWLDRAMDRLSTDAGRTLAQSIASTPSDRWWRAATDAGESS